MALLASRWHTAPMESGLKCVGVAILGLAGITLAILSMDLGDCGEATTIMLIPGQYPPMALTGADWLGSSAFLAILIGIGVPMLLLTAAVWLGARIWDGDQPSSDFVAGSDPAVEVDSEE